MARAREFDEPAVLDTALALFRARGLRRTSMTELARATGLQRGSLYNSYRDKETLFLRAFERYAEGFLADAEATLAAGSLQRRLERFFAAAIANMRAGAPPQGCPTTRAIMEAAGDEVATRAALKALLDRLEALLEQALAEARRHGRFAGDPRRTARLLVAVTRGLAVVERAYDDEARLREIARETLRLVVPVLRSQKSEVSGAQRTILTSDF